MDKETEEMAKAKGLPIKKEQFDEDEFDERVAESTSYVFSKARYMERNYRYKKWCRSNFEELKQMYILADIECNFNEFCSLVFNNKDE